MLLPAGDERLDGVREILADLRKDDQRASEVVRRLRTLLARHEMACEPLDLNDAIADVLQFLEGESRRRRIDIASVFDRSLPAVRGDRVHLQQVVLNLLVNAMDAMAETPDLHRRVIVRTAQHDDGSVEVTVSDQGHGIPQERLPHLFESFYTTKAHGMGLGLSIARSIVEAHGGRIWAESGLGQGASFRFMLPESRAAVLTMRLPRSTKAA
jgi:signal transduction histidine kinase